MISLSLLLLLYLQLLIPQYVICLRVVRNSLVNANLVSMLPTQRVKHKILPVSELLYIPSSISLRKSNSASSILDDDNFLSQLCDRGYPVHCLEMASIAVTPNTFAECVTQSLSYLASTDCSQCLLITNELSSLNMLRYLSVLARNESECAVPIRGVVLIDPPPTRAIRTEFGRRIILQRYFNDHFHFPDGKYSLSDGTVALNANLQTIHAGIDFIDTAEVEAASILAKEVALFEQDQLRARNRYIRSEVQAALGASSRRNKRVRCTDVVSKYNIKERDTDLLVHRSTSTGVLEVCNSVMSHLAAGALTTTDILGSWVPTSSELSPILPLDSVLIIGSILATQAKEHAADGYPSTTEFYENRYSDSDVPVDIIDADTTHLQSVDLLDDRLWQTAGDNWGLESLTETAAQLSAYPVEWIGPSAPVGVESNVFVDRLGDHDDNICTTEEVNWNTRIAHIIDLFLRQLR